MRDRTGSNGNRVGVYGFAQSGSTLKWQESASTFFGGSFPTQYRIHISFGSLQGNKGKPDGVVTAIPTNNVRKIRWTWAADLQTGNYSRSEFQVIVSQWQVTGTGREYFVAGPGSRRIEDDDVSVSYSSMFWPEPTGASLYLETTREAGSV